MRRELALSKAQTDAVLAAANAVPCAWRDRFLASVADRLIGLERITDGDIIAIAEAARVRLIAGMPDE